MKHKRRAPVAETEVTVSFRHGTRGLICAFVTVYKTRGDGQRQAVHSRHISQVDEVLVDLALAEVREAVLEHVLVDLEPF